MIRTDIYIQAPSQGALLADLAALGYVEEGEARFPDGCACVIQEPEGPSHVIMLVSCTDVVAAILRGATLSESEIVDYREGFPVFGGRAEDLERVKASAILSIDAEAERRRGLIVTPGVGQMQEYRLTADEATRAQAAADPLEATDYPYLAAEQAAQAAVGVTWTLRDTAMFVLGEEAAWVAYGAAIKETRRTAKERIKAATSAAQVREILGTLAWPAVPGV